MSNTLIQAHLGKSLRALFEQPFAPLPARLTELLDKLAEQESARRPASKALRDAMLGYMPNLRAFGFSLCGNHDLADDLVQETLLKAWSHIDSFQEGTNLRAWLFTILRNTYFSEVRKRRREVEDAEGKHAGAVAVLPAQQGHVDMGDMRQAMERLPPEQKEALILVAAAGMSYEETAAISQCAVGTVKSRVNRARIKLGELMGNDV